MRSNEQRYLRRLFFVILMQWNINEALNKDLGKHDVCIHLFA